MNTSTPRAHLFFCLVILLPAAVSAQAESTPPDEENADEVIEVIVVTGTNARRTGYNTPQSVSLFDEDELRRYASSSQADLLTQLPGIKAEGGGGEVATNFIVRGLPSGGQFQFTPLEYDGIPTFSTFGLNSSAFDVYYRNDLGIDRLEYVTGGVSNLFGPGSVAGIINYVSKTGGPESEGTVHVEGAERGRFRGDLYSSGPLGSEDSNTFYALSGFYRYDEGPLESGLPTEGVQLRGNLKHDFEDGSGSLTLYGQAIDDRVQFFLPLPLDSESRERLTGNDGDTVYTLNTAEAAQLSYATPGGVFETPIDDGVQTKGGSFAAILDKELGDGWGLNVKAKYARYGHEFNLFLDGDGVVSAPETLQQFLTNRGYGDVSDATYTFTESGQAVPDDFLLFANRIVDRDRDATDFSGEFNLSKSLESGATTHELTLGAYLARAQAEDVNYLTAYLADFRNEPRLVDVSVSDNDGSLTGTPGATFDITRNGLLNAGGLIGDRDRSALRTAVYVADQIEMGQWAFDAGLRFERFEGDTLQRNVAPVVLGNDPTLNDDLETVGFTTGQSLQDEVSETEWAASVGALYRLSEDVNLFANFSRGFFFPQLIGVQFNPLGEFGPYESEIILTGEAGGKFRAGRFTGFATGFYTELDNRQAVEFINDGMGGFVFNVEKTSTRSYGLEVGGTLDITDSISINGNATVREHEITTSENDPSLVGNDLLRQPNVVFNTGFVYDDDRFDFALFHNFHGSNFANSSNTVKLEEYNLVRLDAGYTLLFDDEQSLRIGLNVFNLFDSDGLAEGSPRQGNAQVGDPAEFFVGRPILRRRIMLSATYDF